MFSRDRGAGDGVTLFAEIYGYLILLSRYNFFIRFLFLSSNTPSVLFPLKMVVLTIFAFVSGSINENSIPCYVKKKS